MSLAVTQLIGFGARRAASGGTPTLYSGGTNIGDFTAAGGLAAAFDGNTSQTPAAGARKTGNTTAYVGKNHGSSVYKLSSVIVRRCSVGADPAGFANSGSTFTLTLYGKNSAPASATDGTSLGTQASVSISGTDQTINSTDTSTAYQYFWVAFTGGDGGGSFYCAEVEFYVL